MKKPLRTLMIPALAFAAISGLAACGGEGNGEAVKVGLICLHDETSTYDANFIKAMNEAVAKLGKKVEYKKAYLKTGIAEERICYDTAKELAELGCNVIFADSFNHQDHMLDAAKELPDVQLCHATGTNAKTANQANYHNAFASIYEGRYLAGYAAGLKLLTMDNVNLDNNFKVGYVGAYPYAEVKSGYTSWFLGVRAALRDNQKDPSKVSMDVKFTNEWYDPDGEASAADALIKGGAVLVSQHADSMGAPGTCEQAGVPNVTYNIETKSQCPNTYLAYSRINWAPYYEAVINAVYNKKAIEGEVNHNWTGTMATGSVEFNVNWDNFPADKKADFQAKMNAVEAEVKAKSAKKVFDCSTFTVGGQPVTSYMADTDGDFAGDTEAIVTEGSVSYFNESAYCSAPYFALDIDGINLPAQN